MSQYSYEIVKLDGRPQGGTVEWQGVVYDAQDRVVYRSPVAGSKADVTHATLTAANGLPGAVPYTCRKRS